MSVLPYECIDHIERATEFGVNLCYYYRSSPYPPSLIDKNQIPRVILMQDSSFLKKQTSRQHLNDFCKFCCDRTIKIEVIKEMVLRVTDF